MNSLQKLLADEGFPHSKKRFNVRQEQFPKFICHDLKSINQTTHKPKGSSKRVISESERINFKALLEGPGAGAGAGEGDESAIDEAAVRALISILTGYIGRYGKDSSFREMIRNKCRDCLSRKRKDFDDGVDGVFADIELGIQSIEDSVSKKELKMKSLKNSIELLTIVASLNSKKSRNGSTCGVPNSHISACVQLYLSIAYKLEKNDRVSAKHLLQVFSDSPFLARTHLLPDLWEHLFLPHLLHLKIWHHKESESLSNSQYNALNKAYNGSLDFGTIQFSMYYKEWLKIGGKVPPIPHVPLPSRPSFASSRRISSDSYTSTSSIDRNLYLSVFGPTPEHQSVEFDRQKRDLWIQEDEYKSVNYVSDKVRTYRRSSTQDNRSSKRESWSERSKSSDYLSFFTCQSVVSECLVKGKIVRSNSIRHIQNSDLPMNDLSRAIHTICSSDSLTDCEIAVRLITEAWIGSKGNSLVEDALSKAPVLEGILEVLFASDDDEILELGISILAEFVARNEANRLIVLNSDPQLEIFMRLLKSSSLFLKAAVLLYQLKPKAKQMISIEWVALALRVLEFGDQFQTLFSVRCMPQKAAMYLLDQLLTGFSEDRNLENASQVVSLGGLSFLLRISENGDIDERSHAVLLMSCCIRADSNCRNYLAENVNKTSLLELIALGIQKKSYHFAFAFLTELLCLNRRTQITKFLIELNRGWSGLNTMHIFLVYLQRASPEERPLVAAILLQLDLLGDPLKSSLYKEDAVEAIIEGLDSGIFNSSIQEQSARALLMLGGRFSRNGEETTEEWFLQESEDPYSLNEEEKATKDWQRKAAIVLLNTGKERLLAAISNCIANGIPNLVQSCLFTVAWMNKVLLSAETETSCSSPYPSLLEQLSESLHFDRTLIKSAECMTMLATLDKELIDPLRSP
ncbi:putative E3 ubiquitin-protein ligase LIN-2 [Euphorbia lathyris]|uniref:putative E3 ubiquitin-protein ligase LIN-2 n=1 Tax=Euphorbia lathyris TaxID=212925 RepID=UPI0033137A8E